MGSNKTRKLISFVLSLSTLASFIACGSSGGSSGTVAAVPAPTYMGFVPPNPANPNNCQVGQVDAPGSGCLWRQSCNYGYGWVPGQAMCVPGTVIGEQSVYGTTPYARFFGTMAITNRSQFELLLKYANLCDPYWVGWNFGSWSCTSWSNQGFIEMRAFAGVNNATTNLNLFVGAGSASAGYASNWITGYQLSSSASYIGFSQTAAIVDYNNSQGMQIIGIGPNGVDIGLRMIVNTGRLTNNSFTADVNYQNVKFATITFTRQ